MELLVIILLIMLNGVFSMSEIALVSSRTSKLEQLASKGIKGAGVSLELLKQPERFLSTVQIGITLIGIVAGAYGGVTLAAYVTPVIAKIDFLAPYADELAMIITVGFITYLSLIIGELLPKTIALNNPEAVTVKLAPAMNLLARVTRPVVSFLGASTKVLMKLFGISENTEPPVSEEELKYMIKMGSQHGILLEQESAIMTSVFSFADKEAAAVMTPRHYITWLDLNDPRDENINKIFNSPYTKFPVCEDSLDNIKGIITTKDILKHQQTGGDKDIIDLTHQPLFFPETASVFKVLERFRNEGIHIGFVVDEFGGISGLITLHDLIENLFGDMPDVSMVRDKPLVKREDGSWLADGSLKIEELKRKFGLDELPDEDEYTTLGGLVIHQLRKMPVPGDNFSLLGYTFEIVDMDGNRVDKLMIRADKNQSG